MNNELQLKKIIQQKKELREKLNDPNLAEGTVRPNE